MMEVSCENDREAQLAAHYPLHYSCRHGDATKLRMALATGQYDPSVEDCVMRWSAAHYAAYFGHVDCLSELCNLGLFDNSLECFNQTPLHFAAHGGRIMTLKLLLNRGANMNRQDYVGETPLHKCARDGNLECLSLLLAHNADPNVLNSEGRSAADISESCGHFESAAVLRQRMAALQQARLHYGPPWTADNVLNQTIRPEPMSMSVQQQQPAAAALASRKRTIHEQGEADMFTPSAAKRGRPCEMNGFGDGFATNGLLFANSTAANNNNNGEAAAPCLEQRMEAEDISEAEPYMLEPYKSVLRVSVAPMYPVSAYQQKHF